MNLNFNLWQAMVMTYVQAKYQGQRSVGSTDGNKRMDGQTRPTAIGLPSLLMRLVNIITTTALSSTSEMMT